MPSRPRSLFIAIIVATASSSSGCTERSVGRGNPSTLAPLIGGGGRLSAERSKPPSEPVEDYVADLGALVSAWPGLHYELPRLIRSVIARGSWIDVHHAASCSAGTLRVRHRPAVVAEVAKLVVELSRRLLRPLYLQVAFVEATPAAAARAFPRGKQGVRRFDARAFRSAVARKEARSLTRAMFSAYNGVWSTSERLGSQVFLSGIGAYNGVVTPRTTTLASGATLQAAAWRWGEQRAVVALTGSYTGEAVGGTTVKQTVHRELPRQKTTERRWQEHDVNIQLPVRQLIEFQNTLVVERGGWSVAAIVPRQNGRVCAVVVKVDWQRLAPQGVAVRVNPLARDASFVLEIIPIALPLEQASQNSRRVHFGAEIVNRRNISKQAAGWFRERAQKSQALQKKNTYNFQDHAGSMALSYRDEARANVRARTYVRSTQGSVQRFRQVRRRQPSAAGALGALPPALEALKAQVIRARWPAGSAVEFIANHVFVVHRPDVAGKVVRLLRETHAWRNQRVVTDVAFPVLASGEIDGLSDAHISASRAAKLRRGRTLLSAAYVLGRGGSRAEMFVGEMHATLSGAWAPDASSPPVFVYWRGVRLGVTPRLGRDNARGISLQLKHYQLERLAPRSVAGAVLQQPIDATWTHTRQLLDPGASGVLTGVNSTPSGVLAVLVSARWLK